MSSSALPSASAVSPPPVDPAVAEAVVARIVEDEGVSPGEARTWFKELLRFLDLGEEHGRHGGERRRLVPSKPVDAAWHAFILHTRAYTEHCLTHYGTYVHHTPFPAHLPASEQAGVCFDHRLTQVLMQRRHGPLDPTLWPRDG